LNILDLQVGTFLSLEPRSEVLKVVESQGGEILPIVNVRSGLGQDENQQNQNAFQHSLFLGSLALPLSQSRSNVLTFSVLSLGAPSPSPFTFHGSWFDSPQTFCYAPRRFRACYDKRNLSP
jgi:hypothetical protein